MARLLLSCFASREGMSAPSPQVLMIFRAAARPCFPKAPERPSVRAGVDFAREGDTGSGDAGSGGLYDGRWLRRALSATLAQEDFTTDVKLRAGREDHLSIAETKMRQCSSSEVFRAQ